MNTIGTRFYFSNDDRASIFYGSRSTPDGKHTAFGYYAELLEKHENQTSVVYRPIKLGFYRTQEEAIRRLKNEIPDLNVGD